MSIDTVHIGAGSYPSPIEKEEITIEGVIYVKYEFKRDFSKEWDREDIIEDIKENISDYIYDADMTIEDIDV